ncbi:MAG: autotransporter outer membrane beta-barrel domain-containing protein, partial [Parachlamydia sp.]|nr:autotransporter outer membrane beta-barrel domain-containing protein [Parachlamydia sp.]
MMKRWNAILVWIFLLPASAFSFVPQLPEVVIESVGRQYSNLFTIPRLADRRLLEQLFYPAQSGSADCCIIDREIWYEGEWGKSSLKSDCSGFDLKMVGAIAGAQKYRTQNWLTGVALAAQHNHLFR